MFTSAESGGGAAHLMFWLFLCSVVSLCHLWSILAGSVYKGEFRASKREGSGVETHGNGDLYEGQWQSGKKEGQGKYLSTGDCYEGEFKADEREGRGTQTYANGDLYEGEWAAGKQEGQGKLTRRLSTLSPGGQP